MAAEMGISEATVRRIWHAHGLKAHLVESFKISKDKRFAEKLEDIVGLYLNPPEHAIVMCVDEKSQIQALDRVTTMPASDTSALNAEPPEMPMNSLCRTCPLQFTIHRYFRARNSGALRDLTI